MLDQQQLLEAIPHCLTTTSLPLPGKYPGKVRDTYDLGARLLLITTDRQSGFDRMLGAIPYKGQVLNRTSLHWFEATRHIVANHVIRSPHANALLARKCRVLPIEFVVRGYLTGSTDTAIWTKYSAGERDFAGITLPDNMRKNQQLPAQHGLILVDTKYEFGVTPEGEIILIDEIHTPDSRRYWLAPTYEQRLAEGREPDMIDKEFFRLWFRERCDPYKDSTLPTPPPDLIAELASRYIQLYEAITGNLFEPDLRPLEPTVMEAIAR